MWLCLDPYTLKNTTSNLKDWLLYYMWINHKHWRIHISYLFSKGWFSPQHPKQTWCTTRSFTPLDYTNSSYFNMKRGISCIVLDMILKHAQWQQKNGTQCFLDEVLQLIIWNSFREKMHVLVIPCKNIDRNNITPNFMKRSTSFKNNCFSHITLKNVSYVLKD
jgi:hypothetical protein